MNDEAPKKISSEQIEVLGADGEVVKPSESKTRESVFQGQFGTMKVFRGGPWMLLLLPILIPLAIVFFFIILIFALIFGRSLFKIVRGGPFRPR